MPDLACALAAEPLVLDGGLGTLLEARGNDLTGELWSARLLRDDPDEVRAAHEQFVAAGADVIITSSYQVGFGGSIPDAEVVALLRRSVSVARDAGARFVAASVGPVGALRADGSEYTGDYDMTATELREWHRRRLEILADTEADALAIETVPSLTEATALCAELADLGMPAWISMSASSTGLTEADLSAAFSLSAATPGVFAAGVNCCAHGAVLPALALLPPTIAGVVYPNSGETWHAASRSWRGEPASPTDSTGAWLDAGARLVGGCCRTTPDDVSAIAAAVSEWRSRAG